MRFNIKLIVLCDNNTFIDNYLLGEPALSFYLNNDGDELLFDLGYSENIDVLYPCHCTSLQVKCEMKLSGLNIQEVGSGLSIEIN